MEFLNKLRAFKNRFSHYSPLVEVGISRANLLHNLHTYQESYPNLKFAPVLKSNAYGHDLGLVARLLDKEDIAFFMVDSFYEARRLRGAGVRSRILVMGYVRPEDIVRTSVTNVDFAITDLTQLKEVSTLLTHPTRIHLKLDTGMHRQGITPEDLAEAISLIKQNSNLELVGICSHFADADTDNSPHARMQVKRFQEASLVLSEAFPHIEYKHLAATKGVRYAEEAGTNVARPGIGLYGFDTSPSHSTPLKPVLELRAIIGSVRTVSPGETVGYNATHEVTKESRIATIPAGYFEGVDRRLSGKGVVLVRGVVCPIVGRVSMNMISVDVTGVPEAAPGDSVVLISRNPEDLNSIPHIAEAVSTPEYRESEYVLLTHIPQHLRRVAE
ncbi:MAG: Alanine racemase [Parcubacteria group bacterium]|nr:Alanine racemase [Parcubacteria group bacterium]